MQAVIISEKVQTSVLTEASTPLNAVCCFYLLAIAWTNTLHNDSYIVNYKHGAILCLYIKTKCI